MTQRRPRNSIRGPTSALSSFLRERGIRSSGLSPYGQLPVQPGQNPPPAVDPTVASSNEVIEEENDGGATNGPDIDDDEEEEEIEPLIQPQATASKKTKKRKAPDADDDQEDDILLSRSNHSKRRNINVSFCSNCNRRFTNVGNEKCEACILISGKKIKQVVAVKKKKGKGKAAALAPKLLSDQSSFPSLRDLCIKVFTFLIA
jgi:hypothetical protein